jgi:hypothetical protein
MVALTGEHVTAMPGNGLQAPQHGHGLRGKGHHVRFALLFFSLGALHFGTGNGPQSGVQVEFRPLHFPQVAGALVQQGRKL